MNTRLQVEHPVTELVTGLDLVQLQIRIAAGETLPFTQKDVRLRGHAIEVRIYAEDPDNQFFPSPGKIEKLAVPSGPGIREDRGIYEGWTVPLDYDPMLSKLIAYGSDRAQAIARMERALGEYFIGGIKTNLGLFPRILSSPEFRAGKLDTGLLERLLARGSKDGAGTNESRSDSSHIAVIGAAIFAALSAEASGKSQVSQAGDSAWTAAGRKEALR
jgi:acetyl-CoA carboxylase biotin carboxylase subunit